jgi:hypothetical protein
MVGREAIVATNRLENAEKSRTNPAAKKAGRTFHIAIHPASNARRNIPKGVMQFLYRAGEVFGFGGLSVVAFLARARPCTTAVPSTMTSVRRGEYAVPFLPPQGG